MQIGMLLDVSYNILNELLPFKGEQKFLNKIFCELSGKIMTLINGKHNMPYFDLNELLISSTKYLKNYFSKNKYELKKKNYLMNLCKQIL